MSLWCILTLAEATRVAVVSEDSAFPDPGKALESFLSSQTGNSTTVKTFYGNIEGMDEFQPELVLDYSERLFDLKALVRRVPLGAAVRHSSYDLVAASTNSAPLREDPGQKWEEIASSLAEFFGWKKALVVLTHEASDALVSGFRGEIFEKLNFSKDITAEGSDLLVARTIRNSGIRPIFIVAGEKATNSILTSLTKYSMDTGYAIVLIGTNCQFDSTLFLTGVLCTALRGSETAQSTMEVDYWYTYYALLAKPLDSWGVINQVQGKKYLVGQIEKGQLSFTSSVVFPGGSSSPPDNSPIQVKIGLANWHSPGFVNTQKAAYYALNDLPLSNKNFQASLIRLDVCGIFDEAYHSCYPEVKTQKVSVLLANDVTSLMVDILEWQRVNNLRVPTINTINVFDILDSVESYPNYVLLTQVVTYYSLNLALFVKRCKYTQVNFFVDQTLAPIMNISSVYMHQMGIEVITPPELRIYDSADPDYCRKAAKYLKESNIRPLLAFIYAKDWFDCYLKAFEAVGLGEGDIIQISGNGGLSYYKAVAGEDQEKLELLEKFSDYLQIIWDHYKGEVGAKLQATSLKNHFNSDWVDCFVYDSAALALTAIDFTIRRGLNFYDPTDMMKAIRSVRVQGCTGAISFTLANNCRKDLDTICMQTQDVDEVPTDVKVFSVSVSGSSTYTTYADFLWSDDTSDIPPQSRLNPKDCPFPEEYRRDNEASQKLEVSIVMALFGVTVLIALGSYFVVHRHLVMTPITSPILLATQDTLVIWSTFLEVLLIGLLTPQAGPVNFFTLNTFSQFFNQKNFEDGKLFLLLIGMYGCIGLSVALTVSCAFNKFRTLKVDVQLIAVALSRPLFVVIVFVLFSTFDCSEAAAETSDLDLHDSFMDVDCYETCWEGKHLRYSIASALLFFIFVLVSIPTSAHLTNTLEGLQFETNPRFLLLRVPFLTLFIALLKSSPLISSAVHSALYLILLIAYLLVCLWIKVLPIPTLDFLHSLSLVVLIVLSLCQTLYKEFYSNYLAWLLIGYGAALLIVGLGRLKLKKLPQLTLKPPYIDAEALFKFAFRRNAKWRRSMIRQRNYAAPESVRSEQLHLQ
jgi:hypothetical protein